MIQVLVTHIEADISALQLNVIRDLLPAESNFRADHFLVPEDRQRSLLGKALLGHWLLQGGHSLLLLEKLDKDPLDRPFLPLDADFNISHSGKFVVFVAQSQGRVGVDIEEIRPLGWERLQAYFPPSTWQEILISDSPLPGFFRNWVVMESIVKATGQGIAALTKLPALNLNEIVFQEQAWRIHPLEVADGYCGAVASNQVDEAIQTRFLPPQSLLQVIQQSLP